jgi:hypothetical protein
MEDEDEPFLQDQIAPSVWNNQCQFCPKTFLQPGALTKHMSTCSATRKGLRKRLSAARNINAAKQARLEGQGDGKKKRRWYNEENLDFDDIGTSIVASRVTVREYFYKEM